MKLLIRGPFFLKGNGYASALKAHINVFADVFEQTKFENFKPIGLNEVESNSYNDFITKNLISSNWKPDVTINYLAPNVAQKYRGCFNIIFTYWETDLIPGNANSSNRTKEKNNWVQQLNGYDLVLTASSYAKQAFIDSGVVRPIEVLPWPLEEVSSEVNALNTNFLNVINGEERGLFEIQANSSFILSSIGEYQARKNFHQLIKNFIITFYNDNSKALILKLSNTGVAFYKSNIIIQDIQHYIKSIKLPEPVRCSIYVSTEHLRKSEIINILQSSDYYITTSRGEGMGGPVIEALDLGVPVISGWHTSLKDFLNHSNSIQIDHYSDYIQEKNSVHYEDHQQCAYYRDGSIQQSLVESLERSQSFSKEKIKKEINSLLGMERNKQLFNKIIKQYIGQI